MAKKGHLTPNIYLGSYLALQNPSQRIPLHLLQPAHHFHFLRTVTRDTPRHRQNTSPNLPCLPESLTMGLKGA